MLGVFSLAAAMGLGRKLRCCSVLSPATRPQWVCGTEGPCALGPGGTRVGCLLANRISVAGPLLLPDTRAGLSVLPNPSLAIG